MLPLATPNPSAVTQAAVYMAGIFTGYLMLTSPDDWQRVRHAVVEVWKRRRRD